MIIVAHRGASGTEPENTVLAVRRAVETGSRWIEIDVHYFHGRLIVIHDETLERTTNGSGKWSRLTLEELRGVDAGKGERIPFLEEIVEAAGPEASVNIELKGKATAGPVADFLKANPHMRDRLLVSSFRAGELRALRGADPETRLAPLAKTFTPEVAQLGREVGAWSINLAERSATAEGIRAVQENGWKAFFYTVNEPERWAELQSWGADGIFTDYPERVFAWQRPRCGYRGS